MKSKFLVILRVAISVGLIAFLVWTMRSHLPRIASTLARTNLWIFASAILLFLFNISTMSVRLKILLAGEGLNIAYGRIVQLSFIGFFFNNFMPSAVGGDVVKAYYAYRQTNEGAKSFIAVFMDRFIGLFSFVAIALVAVLLSWENIAFALKKVILIFAGVSAISLLITLNSSAAKVILKVFSKLRLWNVGEKLSRIYRAVHEYRERKALVFAVFGISFVAQSIYFATVFLCAMSLGAELPVKSVLIIMPIVSVVSMLPSLGGLGIREGAMVVLFGPIIGSDNAFSLSILILAMLLIASLVGGLMYVFAAQFKIKKEELSKLGAYSV